jgi:hypothetical protein
MENGQSLINQESHQPASECAIMTEPWWVARRSAPAVPYSKFGSFGIAEDSARGEVKQRTRPCEAVIEYSRMFPLGGWRGIHSQSSGSLCLLEEAREKAFENPQAAG